MTHLLATAVEAGVFDYVNDKLASAQTTIGLAVSVVAVVLFIVVAAKSKLQLAPTLLALLGAGAVVWLASGGGLEWFAGLLGQEFGEASGLPGPGGAGTGAER